MDTTLNHVALAVAISFPKIKPCIIVHALCSCGGSYLKFVEELNNKGVKGRVLQEAVKLVFPSTRYLEEYQRGTTQ